MNSNKSLTHGAMWAKFLRLKLSRKNSDWKGGGGGGGGGGEELIFPCLRERGRELKLLSMIYRDQLVGIHRAKNDSSST